MPRFFVIQDQISSSSAVTLSGQEAHHLRVMRHQPGDYIYVTDGSGHQYKGKIKEMGGARVIIEILEEVNRSQKSRPRITLGQAIPRFNQLEFILQKTTELGVDRICLLQTERSFLKKHKPVSPNRWQRWERLITEAAKQSGRIDFPEILTPQTLDHFLITEPEGDIKICLWEEAESDQAIKDFLREINPHDSISMIIGPEGSFSHEEIRKIEASGYHLLSCGPRIMRVETAALTCMAICQYEWGDF